MNPRRFARAQSAAALMLVAAVLPASWPTVGHAQTKAGAPSKKDLDAAKKAFFEGTAFEEAKEWAKALERFEQVAKVRMTPAVRFHIALCKENLGMLIEALHDFELAETDAKAEKVETVAKEAPEHAAAIKPKIPKLIFKVPADVDGLAVTLDGSPIDPKGGEEMLVNPGKHKVEATAEKRHPFAYEVTLEAGESKKVDIKVPVMAPEAPPPQDEEAPPPPPPPTKRTPVSAIVVGSVGLAALAVGGFAAYKRSSLKSELDPVCGADLRGCPADKQSAIDSGKTYTTLTNVLLAVGIVGVGAGVVLWATAPTKDGKKDEPKPAAAAVRVVPSAPGADVAGLSLAGAF